MVEKIIFFSQIFILLKIYSYSYHFIPFPSECKILITSASHVKSFLEVQKSLNPEKRGKDSYDIKCIAKIICKKFEIIQIL